MESFIHDDKTFENIDYSENQLSEREFNNCIFVNCNFQKADLSNNDFEDCHFKGCNFSLATLSDTGIKNLIFTDCKLMGVDFSRCSNFLFAASFENCILDYSSFFKKKMKKAGFAGCSMKSVNFEESDLSLAVFKSCDLQNATFVHTNLEKTDFRSAINYSFDPEMNRVKGAKFSYDGLPGLLGKYQIDIE